MKIKCNDVVIGERVRKDLGELDTLINSIKELGLLQPIGITENNELIFGHRRLIACMMLGLEEIEANIINIDDIIRGEYAENIVRKDFNMSERDAIRKLVEPKIQEESKSNMSSGGRGVDSAHLVGKTRDKVAKILKIGKTKMKQEEEIMNYGDKDIIEKVDTGEMSVNEAQKEIKKVENKRKIIIDRHTTLLNTDSNLHLGDCLEILNSIPDKSIDMCLTDPPFGINFVSNHRIEKYKEITNDDNNMIDLLDKVLSLLELKIKDNASLYLFSSWKVIDIVLPLIKKYFRAKNLLIWNKNNWSMGDLNNYAEKYEFIIYADKGNHKIVSDTRPLNVLDFNRTTNKHHPTEKPIDLLEYLITHSTIEEELICDPFMGAGSAILAAKNTNRKYLGIEINKEYYNTVLKRLQCQ